MIRRLAVPLTLLLLPATAWAGPLALDLPADTLGGSIARLGRAGEVSISVADGALWRRPVPAIRGKMSVKQALDRLAKAAGGEVQPAGTGGWRIVARATPRPRAIPPAPPAALPPDPVPSADIVVTASKRDLRLHDLAGMATVISGADLDAAGPPGTEAILARLASLSSTHLGAGRNKLFIRGIADSSFTGPTQSTVGQYLGDLRLAYNAPDPDLRLYDMASVEVLEGPQGSLYGAGSLGGIIRLNPVAPQLGQTGGWTSIGASATQHGDPGGDVAAALNLPVNESVALRAVGYGASEGGYIDNPLRGKKDVNRTRIAGGRATARWEAGDGWTIDLGGVFQHTRGLDSQYADRFGPRLSRSSAVQEGFSADYALGQIVIAKDWDTLRFRSTSGVVGQKLRERYDATTPFGAVVPGAGLVVPLDTRSFGEPRLFAQANATRLFATESRLWRPMADGFGWVLGASFTANRTRLDRSLGAPDAIMPVTGVTNRISEGTLYGEASVEPYRGLILTAGARVSHARLSGAGDDVVTQTVLLPVVAAARAAVVAKRDETRLLPSASAVAHVLPGASLFVRYQEGFRPGGLAIEGSFVRRFQSDRVRTLETGVRLSHAGDHPADLSLGVSHTRWRDIQADFIDATGLPSTANIGDGRIWTITAAGSWRASPTLTLDAGLAWNDSRVTDAGGSAVLAAAFARGSRVPNVAGFAARAGFAYRRPIGDDLALSLSGWARYVGRSRLGVGPVLGEVQGDYADSALTLRIGRPALGVTLGATNLTDAVGNRFALGTPFTTGREQITPLRPRTVRLGLDAHF